MIVSKLSPFYTLKGRFGRKVKATPRGGWNFNETNYFASAG